MRYESCFCLENLLKPMSNILAMQECLSTHLQWFVNVCQSIASAFVMHRRYIKIHINNLA